MSKELDFHLQNLRGSWAVVFDALEGTVAGRVRPASDVEVHLWAALMAAEARLEATEPLPE